MIKAFVFDMDGTLVDSKEAVIAQLTDYSLSLNREPLPREQLVKLIGRTDHDIARVLIGDDESTIERAIEWFNETHTKYYGKLAKLFPGVEDCLRFLKSKGYMLGIATNATAEMVRQFMEWSKLKDIVDASVSADEVPGKPAPDMILKLAELFGAEPSEIVYVGDTVLDVMAAKSAGALSIAVVCGVDTMDELLLAKPDLILPLASWVCRAFNI